MVDPERYFNIILCANLAISYQNIEIYYLRSMYNKGSGINSEI